MHETKRFDNVRAICLGPDGDGVGLGEVQDFVFGRGLGDLWSSDKVFIDERCLPLRPLRCAEMREESNGTETQDGDESPDAEVSLIDTETALSCAVAFAVNIVNVGRECAHE